MEILIVAVTLLAVLAAVAIAVLVSWPLLGAVRERQRIEAEARLAEWQLRQITRQAMQQLLHEARRSR